MGANSFGRLFKVITFGESHGKAVGLIIDGCPAGLAISEAEIQQDLDRRKPGQSAITTSRNESDQIQILSGFFEGRTTGAPIAMMVFNKDAKSSDYEHLRTTYRPGHADFSYDAKFGFRDHRGGGRSSARETLARVAAGAIAKKLLSLHGIETLAWVNAVKDIKLQNWPENVTIEQIEANLVRCPDPVIAEQMESLILATKEAGDTVGGIIAAQISGVPAGWGEPVFDKLHARLAYAMMGINAVKGFEYGSGFEGTHLYGSEHNDVFVQTENGVETTTNHNGGILGGISIGAPITFRVAFKPVSTIMRSQESINQSGEKVILEGRGRHDPCVLPRAVPIVEAMANLCLVDFMLLTRGNKI